MVIGNENRNPFFTFRTRTARSSSGCAGAACSRATEADNEVVQGEPLVTVAPWTLAQANAVRGWGLDWHRSPRALACSHVVGVEVPQWTNAAIEISVRSVVIFGNQAPAWHSEKK